MENGRNIEDKSKTEALRAQAALLLSQLRAQLAEIAQALGAANGNSDLHSRLAAAAAQIGGVASELSHALSSPTFSLRSADLASLASAAGSGGASALVAAAETQSDTNATLAAHIAVASADTRSNVQSLSHDIFDRHIFDPYLHFTSPADEAAFRKREADTKKYVDEQLARNTPEGNFNAAGAMESDLLDAHAHGAGKSPDFSPGLESLAETADRQRAAMHAAGQSTEEYDCNVSVGVRRFLKQEAGLTDAEIDDRLAKAASPHDAVKPFLQSGSDGQKFFKTEVQRVEEPAANIQIMSRVGAPSLAPTRDGQLTIDFEAVNAKLRAAGLRVPDTCETDTRHGLTVQKPARKVGPTLGEE